VLDFIKIGNLWFFIVSLLIFLIVVFFFLFKYYEVMKKEKKLLLSVEKSKLKKLLFLDLLFIFTIFSFSLYFSDIKIKTNELKGTVYLFLLDTSGSMNAQDLKPSRLKVAKEITLDFINKNEGLFGIITFNDYPKLLVFPTKDKEIIKNKLNNIKAEGGTNMGDALALAYSILDNFQGYNKVIILLSDGKPTVGTDPLKVVEENKDKAVVFTIAIGKENYILGYDVFGNPLVAEVDKELLKKIAETTGGKFFEVENKEELFSAYKNIFEKTKEYYYKSTKDQIVLFSFVLLSFYFITKIILYVFF
jgi:Ca-activated chloride channel family protein